MTIYKKSSKSRAKWKQKPPLLMPSIELEESNEDYFKGLVEKQLLTSQEVETLKLITCRQQFEDHCRLKGYAFQMALF